MRQPILGILGAAIAITTLSAVPAHGAAPVAKVLIAQLKVSGDRHYAETFSHPEDGTYRIPSQYSCIHFTHPNFAPESKPQAYALSFNNPNVMAATTGAFVSFYYDPRKLSGQHVDGDGESVVLAVPAKNVAFAPGGVGTYTVVVQLAPDLHSGSITATNLRNVLGSGHVSIKLSWRCPTVFVRAT